jgi:hypothetical protein
MKKLRGLSKFYLVSWKLDAYFLFLQKSILFALLAPLSKMIKTLFWAYCSINYKSHKMLQDQKVAFINYKPNKYVYGCFMSSLTQTIACEEFWQASYFY